MKKMCSSSSVLSVSLCLLLCLSSGDVIIIAESGQSVSLPCRAPSNTHIVVLEWTRPELEPEYVLMFKDGWSDLHHQHPSYQNRVELKDRGMKDGDVSMILKNVTRDDAGTYECRVFMGETNNRKRSSLKSEPISIVHLQVHQSGSQHASVVETYEGESVLLPCDFPKFDLDNPSVVWSRSDLHPPTVHQRLSDGDSHTDQNQDYRGRTFMRNDALRTGDLSLTLRDPTTRDSGDYTCILRGEGQERLLRVTLQVKEHTPLYWLTIGLAVALVVLAVQLILLKFIRREKSMIVMKKKRRSSQSDA